MKNRIVEIEYLRGFAILAVISIHTSGYAEAFVTGINLLSVSNIVMDIFSHYAVPLFIFISGFVLSMKYNINNVFDKKTFYVTQV